MIATPTPQTASLDDVLGRSFDYVICGGGTAGLCLAARLTEDPNVSVLVLEAGGANLNDPDILRPASYGSHFGKPEYSWAHKTVPQKFAGGQEYHWPRGKTLGGSSAINFMCWTKPHSSDIDDWEKLGNPGWNWTSYEKYCHRTERFTFPDPEVQKKHNLELGAWKSGTSGPLVTAFPANIVAAELEVQQTLINLGFPVAPKPLGGDPIGVFFAPNTVDPTSHTRTYAASAFYLPNAGRENLSVLCNAAVEKIITTHDDCPSAGVVGKAVSFNCNGRVCLVSAQKEIILSAGSLKTPQILQLSGIGDRTTLENLKIPVQLDLPVGRNVQEHLFCGVTWELGEHVTFDTLNLLLDPDVATKHKELHAAGDGMFTMGIVGFAFTGISMMCGQERAKEICANAREKIMKNSSKYPPGLLEQYNVQLGRLENDAPGCELISFPGLLSGPNPPESGKKYITMIAAINHCFSRGTILCTSTDPSVDPEFDPHYLEEEVDLDIFIEMVKFVRKLADAEPFKGLVVREVNPGRDIVADEQLEDWLKQTMMTTFHTASSTSMLPKQQGGAVDANLKVYGTENIRVVDLSVVPLHIGAHPQATVYSIAEKAADIIKGAI